VTWQRKRCGPPNHKNNSSPCNLVLFFHLTAAAPIGAQLFCNLTLLRCAATSCASSPPPLRTTTSCSPSLRRRAATPHFSRRSLYTSSQLSSLHSTNWCAPFGAAETQSTRHFRCLHFHTSRNSHPHRLHRSAPCPGPQPARPRRRWLFLVGRALWTCRAWLISRRALAERVSPLGVCTSIPFAFLEQPSANISLL
jgi:hypothetical protein